MKALEPDMFALSEIINTRGGTGGEKRGGAGTARKDLIVCRKDARGAGEDVKSALGKSSINITFFLLLSVFGNDLPFVDLFPSALFLGDGVVETIFKQPNLPARPTNSSNTPVKPELNASSSPGPSVGMTLPGFFHSSTSKPISFDRTSSTAVLPEPAEPFSTSSLCFENPSKTCFSQDRTSETFFGLTASELDDCGANLSGQGRGSTSF